MVESRVYMIIRTIQVKAKKENYSSTFINVKND